MDCLSMSFKTAWPKLPKQAFRRARLARTNPVLLSALKPTHSSESFATSFPCSFPLHTIRPTATNCSVGLATACGISRSFETRPAEQHHPTSQPSATKLFPTTRHSPNDPTSDSKPSGDPGRSPGPKPGGPSGPDDPPGLPFRIRYWILLLAQYGGLYGTAAVLIAAVTHIDPFGGFHWDASDVCLGLMLLAPVMSFDALVGLPNWSSRQEDAAALARLFLDPDLLPLHPARPQQQQQQRQEREQEEGRRFESEQQPGLAESQLAMSQQDPLATPSTNTPTNTVSGSTSGWDASTSISIPAAIAPRSPSPSAPSSRGPLWSSLQRLRMALELMQESQVRNNPGARLHPAQEAALILVAVTADEMLYRAVVLTLFGHWLRDRLYEAGAEEVLVLPSWPHIGGGGAGVWELDTAAAGAWGALAVGAGAGVAVFVAKAWHEAGLSERVKEARRAEREEAAKELRKQRLQGRHVTAEEEAQEAAAQARLEAAHRSLADSIGLQRALVWGLEGGREVYQVTAAGAAFVLTGNLAAPLAGSLLSQALMSVYQRLGLHRAVQRQMEALAQRKAALQQQKQQEGQEVEGQGQKNEEGTLKQLPLEDERGVEGKASGENDSH